MSRARAALIAAAVALLSTTTGRADLDHDVGRLAEEWQKHGRVTRQKPRFVERSSPVVIFAPQAPPGTRRPRCLTLAVVGPSSTHFVVRLLGAAQSMRDADDAYASLAGMVEVTRCGPERLALGALLVEMRSPRAVLETLLVESNAPLPRAVKVVPQRDPGPIEPLTLPDAVPTPLPLATRASLAETRLRRDGGRELTTEPVAPRADGRGSVRRTLNAGCYRFELVTESAAETRAPELTVVPEVDGPAHVVSVERGDGLQTSVNVCSGAEARLDLGFSGAPAGAPVLLVSARWQLPDGLPESWGHPVRAKVAAILRRHSAKVSGFPVDQALGVQGPTLLPLKVEPGACYVGVAAAIGGRPSGLSLAAVAPGVSAQNRTTSHTDGTLISFCVRSGTEALVEIDSRGYAMVWLFALFQTGRIELGMEALP